MLIIRPWRADDRPAVLALNAELQEHERALRPSRTPGAEMTEGYIGRLEARLDDEAQDGALFVAEEDGRVVGFLCCFVDNDVLERVPREVFITDLVVTAAAQRRGVGRALVGAVRAFARDRGITRLVVTVLEVNEGAAAAYRALGFRPAARTLVADLP